MRNILYVAAMSLLIACALEKTVSSSDVTKSLIADCPIINGVESLLADDGPEIIIIGETHGMKEPPAFVDALVCHSLAKGHETALALEVSDKEGWFEAYLASDGSVSAKAKLFNDWMWKGEFTDGRSSNAMLDLLDMARIKKQAEGLNVIMFKADDLDTQQFMTKNSVSGVDEFDRNSYSKAYEKAMAENILQDATEVGADKTIVLVGNVHARRSSVKLGVLDYPAMAAHMPSPRTLTFNAVYTAGTSWNCTGAKPSDCGSSQTGNSISVESDIVKSGVLAVISAQGRENIPDISKNSYSPKWYDGVVYVGAATASPPANLGGRIPYVADEAE